MFKLLGFENLPVELLHEVQLFVVSEHLPHISRYFHDVFKHASPHFSAQYLLFRIEDEADLDTSEIYTHALRYPICSQPVLHALHSVMKHRPRKGKGYVHLPTRLFRSLVSPASVWTTKDEPIPFLRYLFDTPGIPKIDTNYPDGYALTKAVHARSIPLVELLLEHHASPKHRDNLSVKVAIRQKDLLMVKLLVERRLAKKGKNKKRKLEDRVQLDSMLLKIAVSVGATDIVDYLYKEKGVVPDVQTLKNLR
ncbi:hypothetical protein CPB83DRAFT_773186 [Crepidotus variabilis]|uniref:Uncharacterized protein n=1 Tax=Crepidotus variabilis TaxID=179855 RepID=A0A9P6E9A4_9AGAR|nr:hypothetical protein CPB83DRAFT_773186 [Crepidotus variabilis]